MKKSEKKEKIILDSDEIEQNSVENELGPTAIAKRIGNNRQNVFNWIEWGLAGYILPNGDHVAKESEIPVFLQIQEMLASGMKSKRIKEVLEEQQVLNGHKQNKEVAVVEQALDNVGFIESVRMFTSSVQALKGELAPAIEGTHQKLDDVLGKLSASEEFKALYLQMKAEKEAFEATVRQLTEENKTLVEKNKNLESLSHDRNQLVSDFETMRNEIREERRKFNSASRKIGELENEKNRLEREKKSVETKNDELIRQNERLKTLLEEKEKSPKKGLFGKIFGD